MRCYSCCSPARWMSASCKPLSTKSQGLRPWTGSSGDMKLPDISGTLERGSKAVDYFCASRTQAYGCAGSRHGGRRPDRLHGRNRRQRRRLSRCAACDGLRFLGVDLDAEANFLANASSVHTSHSAIKVNVLQTDEESILARKAAAHLDGSGSHETK